MIHSIATHAHLFSDELWWNRVYTLHASSVLSSQSSDNASTVAPQRCKDLQICLDIFHSTANTLSVVWSQRRDRRSVLESPLLRSSRSLRLSERQARPSGPPFVQLICTKQQVLPAREYQEEREERKRMNDLIDVQVQSEMFRVASTVCGAHS